MAISLPVMFSPMISGSQVRRSSPVNLRMRRVRRYNMFALLVSGSKKKRKTKQKPESHIISQMVQLQPSACAAKPPTRGPRTGPQIVDLCSGEMRCYSIYEKSTTNIVVLCLLQTI
jgi:hypothetical protein